MIALVSLSYLEAVDFKPISTRNVEILADYMLYKIEEHAEDATLE